MERVVLSKVASMGGDDGFTLIELTIALVILSIAVLGITASAGSLARSAGSAEVKSKALQAVDDRVSLVLLDPRYAALDSIYEGVESGLPGLDGFSRNTEIDLVTTSTAGGKPLTYQSVTVTVTGPGLLAPMTRSAVVGAP